MRTRTPPSLVTGTTISTYQPVPTPNTVPGRHMLVQSHIITQISHRSFLTHTEKKLRLLKKIQTEKIRNICTDGGKFLSSLRPPPARHMVMARYTYVHLRLPPCQRNNDLHIPAGSHSEYATRETNTCTESHLYTHTAHIVSNPYRKQITAT